MGNILVPIKKFLSNKNTITILGVLLGLVVLYFGYNWRVTQSTQPTKIPYANTTMLGTTKITESNISYTEVPKSMIKNMTNLVTNPNNIVGMLVAYDSKIAVNSFFFKENLMTEDEMPDSVFSNIPDGNTIFYLTVDFETTYSNSIRPGDSIDLYIKTEVESDESKLAFGRLIKSIEVLAVKDKNGDNVFADKDNPTEPAQLLFSVPEELFLLLQKAKYLSSIEIVPVPRNESYTESAAQTELTSEELQSLIIDQTHILQNECTDLTVCG